MTNKAKKIIVCILAVIGISLVVSIVMLYHFVNPTTLLRRMTTTIHEKTGYQVSTQGSVHWSLYPFLAIEIEELNLTKPGDPSPMLTLKEVAMSTPWDFQKIRANNWHFTLLAKELMLHRFKATHVKTDIMAGNDSLTVDNLEASCYQGTLSATARFEKLPALGLKWQLNFSNIELSQLLRDLNGENAKVSIAGPANIQFNGGTQSLDKEPLQNAMVGTLQFNMLQGSIQGIDLNYMIEKGIALLTQQKTSRKMTSNTQFQQFNGTIYFADNIAKSDNIHLQADAFIARIAGEVSLSEQTLDASIEVKPIKTPGLMIPLLLTGPLNKPNIALDTLLIQAILTKEAIDKVKVKVEKELEKIPERANKFLNSLIGEPND